MYDAGIGRHDAESLERSLRPPQQRIALAVALELEVGIHLKRGGCAEFVHDHGVIDHELGGEQRVDLFRVAAHTDRKSTRLNSSHSQISYAVFCLKKKKKTK